MYVWHKMIEGLTNYKFNCWVIMNYVLVNCANLSQLVT